MRKIDIGNYKIPEFVLSDIERTQPGIANKIYELSVVRDLLDSDDKLSKIVDCLIDRYLKTKKGQRIYNSLYVPLAKVIGSNKGYCFINLVSPKYVVEFFKIFNGLVFNIKNCKKPCTVVFSDNQNVDCSNEDALKRPIIFTDVINN